MTNAASSSTSAALQLAPGEVIIVRDAEWLVLNTSQTTSGTLVHCVGLSELVRDTTASFYSGIDDIQVLDPSDARVVADGSSKYTDARLWLESTLRRQPVPIADPNVTVSTRMLADTYRYQQEAVRRALDPANLRPRLLIADAVGLGKTIEIGMILSELVRRGLGERILIVTPKHVLEQMQREMWTRFALPFVRLDSVGLQRVRQQLPATRNPFSYFKRAIISIDTLKSPQYRSHLEKFHWDAVVIDESHNITGATQNNQLARTLAPNTHALILASATPHNGREESFAELIRLLEPSAVGPDGTFDQDAVQRLVLRRHRHSEEVSAEVGANWAERMPPQNLLVAANRAENAIAEELTSVWLHPASGVSPYSGENKGLFPWTLAKAFLSSPVAFQTTVRERMKRLGAKSPEIERELDALKRLDALAIEAIDEGSTKLARLIDYLKEIGVGKGSDTRAVVFSERVATLEWLREGVAKAFKFNNEQVQVLHGQLTDVEQQQVVEDFSKVSSDLRVLITGDVASEGVNLHRQCHELIHFDIPWSLIRIEQRNGRIDRYGQRERPQITTLLLDLDNAEFAGDTRVLARLVDREDEAHRALGESSSLMGEYGIKAEEDAIREVLRGKKQFDEVVPEVSEVTLGGGREAFMAKFAAFTAPKTAPIEQTDAIAATGLFGSDADFFRAAMHTAYAVPTESVARNGVGLVDDREHHIVKVTPPVDLQRRLEVLPQSYLSERHITESFTTTTSKPLAERSLGEAHSSRTSTSLWPTEHFLGPLHPMLDWAADKTLAALGRNEVFAVRGSVDLPTIYALATLTDRKARTVASIHLGLMHLGPGDSDFLTGVHESAEAAITAFGLRSSDELVNPGPVDTTALQPLIPAAIASARAFVESTAEDRSRDIERRVREWTERLDKWRSAAAELPKRREIRERTAIVSDEQQLAESLLPQHLSVRPLLVVVPRDWPAAAEPQVKGGHRGE